MTTTAAASSSSSSSEPQRKHRLVFLGTPEPAACVLRSLLEASRHSAANFEVAAVVSQPAKAQGRGRKAAPPSPVAAAATLAGFSEEAPLSAAPPLGTAPPPLLCPASPKDESFLDLIDKIEPDLCVTVAYGGLLNSRFLKIPKRGTLNIHPSLLPRWRGAAPVQRTLAAGDEECGVSLAFTVLALDAGPVLASEKIKTPPTATAPELLSLLVSKGEDLLLKELPRVLSGEASFEAATPQAEVERRALEENKGMETFASHAARLTRGDGRIDPFTQSLKEAFDRWRSAAGWPGGWLVVKVEGEVEESELKLEEAAPAVSEAGVEAAKKAFSASSFPPPAGSLAATKEALLIVCADGGILKVTTVKPAGRKAMGAGAWANGLGGRKVEAVKAEAKE